jgi:hypothetical protein
MLAASDNVRNVFIDENGIRKAPELREEKMYGRALHAHLPGFYPSVEPRT